MDTFDGARPERISPSKRRMEGCATGSGISGAPIPELLEPRLSVPASDPENDWRTEEHFRLLFSGHFFRHFLVSGHSVFCQTDSVFLGGERAILIVLFRALLPPSMEGGGA